MPNKKKSKTQGGLPTTRLADVLAEAKHLDAKKKLQSEVERFVYELGKYAAAEINLKMHQPVNEDNITADEAFSQIFEALERGVIGLEFANRVHENFRKEIECEIEELLGRKI